MKRIVLIILLLADAALASAQQKNKATYEFGAGYNAYGILGACGGPARYLGPGAYFECRGALDEHFDMGVQLNYKYGEGHSAFVGPGTPVNDIVYNQAAVKAVADYNARPSRTVNPYLGVGLGAGKLFENCSNGTKENTTYGTLGARMGIQIWRLRLALEADFAFSGGYMYGFISEPTSTALNIGFTF